MKRLKRQQLVLLSFFFFGFFSRGHGSGNVSLNGVRTTRPPTVEAIGKARERIEAEEDEDRERGVTRNHDKEKREHHDEPEGDRAHNGVALTREERSVRDHRESSVEGHHGSDFALIGKKPFGQLAFATQPHKPANQSGSGGRGQTLEVVLAHNTHITVKASETKNGAEAVDERNGPTQLAKPLEGVFVDDEARSYAETHGVSQGVHLNAEFRLGVREASHTTVHAVKKHGEEYSDRSGNKVAVHRGDDAVESREESGSRKSVRKNVNALAFNRIEATLTDGGQTFALRCVGIAHLC